MKKYFAMAGTLCLLAACSTRTVTEYPVVKNDLRAPAYPLVTIDPYTSAWSMTDNLYDSQVSHWTGQEKSLIGVVKVDGETYRFMGVEKPSLRVVVPTSVQDSWSARYTFTKPAAGWTEPDFDDSAWEEGPAAFGHDYGNFAATEWGTPTIWVRRTVEIPEDLSDKNVILQYSHDDDATFYINGREVFFTGLSWGSNKEVELSDEARAALRPGTNVIAAVCNNRLGGGILDFGLTAVDRPETVASRTVFARTAEQTSADVQPTQTHYDFTAGPVDLRIDFTAPMFMDDLESLSRPVNYVTYTVKSNDGKPHDVELYFEALPDWALSAPGQKSVTDSRSADGIVYLCSGSEKQNVLGKAGDHVCIDWGYFYLAAPDDRSTAAAVAAPQALREAFAAGTPLSDVEASGDDLAMAFTADLGRVDQVSGMFMVGYDDIRSIRYFGDDLRPYWNRSGDKTIESQFKAALADYPALYEKCHKFDKEFMEQYTDVAGKKYADLCALAYRQTLAAHKLVEAPNGDLLYMSKENDSNGSIGTVDITYPTAPIFLCYNPKLAEALMNHIFYYTESGKWDRKFPAHDVGTYPHANGQTYGGDMPVEESGNMIITTAAVCNRENSTDYAEKHWAALTDWADYLVEYGLDPENQLCTDDFAGHFAHNANLSVKAIVAIAAYADLARRMGDDATADKYMAIARDYAAQWKEKASAGDHYGLTFENPDSWSQKYNLVWDRLLGLNVFDPEIVDAEVAYYQTRQNKYGLPLDNRETYTKSDWILWTATLDGRRESFDALVGPLYDFYNETVDRVPMSDWVYTDRPERRGFKARAVVGGYFIKMLDHLMQTDKQ